MLLSGGREAVKTVWQTANILRKDGFGAAVRSSIEDLADWAEVERPDLARLAPSGKVAILFSDIEESTALNERIGDRAWVRLIGRHDKMVRRHVKKYSGHVVKSQGDGFMVAFAQPDEAVRCSLDIQRSLRQASPTAFGCASGSTWASRCGAVTICSGATSRWPRAWPSEADGGEVLVSEVVREALTDLDGFEFDGGREAELKGFTGTYRLYAVARLALARAGLGDALVQPGADVVGRVGVATPLVARDQRATRHHAGDPGQPNQLPYATHPESLPKLRG